MLANGADEAKSSVKGVSRRNSKIGDSPQLSRNTDVKYDFKLGFPSQDNLSNFFRNGGTLNLAYADIPEATG